MTAKAIICDWFTFMLSIPRTEPMTSTQKFTQWSALVAYCGGGLTLLICPQLWQILLQLDLQGRTEGYLRLSGLGILVIGFIFVISARSNLQRSSNGTILASVLSRLLYVNGILAMMVLRDMLPLSFALVFMVLDTVLSLITLVIWFRETEGASMLLFLREALSSILRCDGFQSGPSIAAIFLIGIFQLFFWLIFVIRPDIAQQILQLDPFQGYSNGFLGSVFFTLSIHGVYHVTNANAVNHPFVAATVFYRILLNVPAILILLTVDQIELSLGGTLLAFDVCFSIIILLLATFSKKVVSTEEGDERTVLTSSTKE